MEPKNLDSFSPPEKRHDKTRVDIVNLTMANERKSRRASVNWLTVSPRWKMLYNDYYALYSIQCIQSRLSTVKKSTFQSGASKASNTNKSKACFLLRSSARTRCARNRKESTIEVRFFSRFAFGGRQFEMVKISKSKGSAVSLPGLFT